MDIKKINVFTIGESTDINTWSNVPFHLCAALERRATLRRINLLPERSRTFDALRLFSPLWPMSAASCVDSFRTRLHSQFIERRLAGLSRSCNDADLNLFLTFSFSPNRAARVPVVYYCDRTYEHFLEETAVRPARRDRYFIEHEKENLRNALCVFVSNELCRDFIRDRYAINVVLLKAGINVEVASPPDPEILISEKLLRKDVVFIARGAHRRGLDILIDAFRMAAANKGNLWQLHIIGVKADEVPVRDERIHVYGYLRKDQPAERAVYYDLLRRARLFVCPVRKGQPPTGSILEAQLMCTPVVLTDVSDSRDLVTDGYNGVLVDSLQPEKFAHHISRLIEEDAVWSNLARNAHESIKQRTWDRTASGLLEAAQARLRERPACSTQVS